MKPVYVNGRCVNQSTIEEVQKIYGSISKKIIETKYMISVVTDI